MNDATKFYIDGRWVESRSGRSIDVINPSSEEAFAKVAMASATDVDEAVAAARRAFPSFSRTTRAERIDLLESVINAYQRRSEDLAEAVSQEMGAPITLARQAHAAAGLGHLTQALAVLKEYDFDETFGTTVVTREAIGVVGLITPWNWPMNQIGCKVGPALAAGCTMVLKPSEVSPISGIVFAEIMDDAGVPAGIFNLINGDGPGAGSRLSEHPDVDMISFTGSTRAGILVAKTAADTIKRVCQELGGKSPNIILDDADFDKAIRHGTRVCFNNSGQSCNAPTRMLVPAGRQDEAVAIAKDFAEKIVVGNPALDQTVMGPVANGTQFAKIQSLIELGISEGARLVTGGVGRPTGTNKGYYVRPTIFADVRNDMTIAREEVFGPVLSILPYESEAEAVQIANDTSYGLSSYVTSGDIDRARRLAREFRAGMVHINGAPADRSAPFGGYKQSGNGREWGRHGFEEFLEVKSMFGYQA